jgi:serpin B
VDFLGDGVKTVNAWCAEKTHDKIREILKSSDVDAVTAAVLTNALYFKGDWRYQFKKAETAPGPFHCGAGKTVEAPLMYQLAELPYHAADGVQVLELPYKGGDLSMLVLLPTERDGLAAVEAGLSAERLEQWVKALRPRKVRVTLPRFKLAGDRLELKDKLEALGLPIKAEPNIGTPPPGMFLYIASVLHKTFVEVNEEGAEAAAVTAVVVKWKDKGGEGDDTVTFRADHPFLFLIRDNRSGCVLFLGRLQEPK